MGVVISASFAILLAALSIGNRAPDFELQGSDGKRYSLNDLLAQGEGGGIVLAWFPKAFTPG
jgi:peroxiredoxin Q/BCP